METYANPRPGATPGDSLEAIEEELLRPSSYEAGKPWLSAGRALGAFIDRVADEMGIRARIDARIERDMDRIRSDAARRARVEYWNEYRAVYVHRAITEAKEEIEKAYWERGARRQAAGLRPLHWKSAMSLAEEDGAKTLIEERNVGFHAEILVAWDVARSRWKWTDAAVRREVEGEHRAELARLDQAVMDAEPWHDGLALEALIRRREALGEKRELSADHVAHLAHSAITPAQASAAGLWTEEWLPLVAAMMRREMDLGSYVVFPYRRRLAGPPEFYRVKETWRGKKGYGHPSCLAVGIYYGPGTLRDGRLRDLTKPLIVTEGEKKCLLLDQLGYAAIAASGVWCLHDAKQRRRDGRWVLHPWIREDVVVAGRTIIIAFDRSPKGSRNVRWATARATQMFLEAGAAEVLVVHWPDDLPEHVKGIDDLAARQGTRAVHTLLGAALPAVSGSEISIPVSAMRSTELTSGEKLVYGALVARSVDRRAQVAAAELAKLLGRTPRAIRYLLESLVRNGWLERRRGRPERDGRTDKWRRDADTYTLTRDPAEEQQHHVGAADLELGDTPALVVATMRHRADDVPLAELAESIGTSVRTVRRAVRGLGERARIRRGRVGIAKVTDSSPRGMRGSEDRESDKSFP